MFFASSATIAYQDVAALMPGSTLDGPRWAQTLRVSSAGSTHRAEIAFRVDPITTASTASIPSYGMSIPGVGEVSVYSKNGEHSDTPDEARVNRDDKRGRIVTITPSRAPEPFRAGELLERQSSLLAPADAAGVNMAFAKPDLDRGELLAVAQVFHKKRKPVDVFADILPTAVASLVNNDEPDALALAAYAPSEPDFASRSPFGAILKEETRASGRFIPPIGAYDHGWASKVLPKLSFSEKEQRCLAEGIYFEARGEPEKGQAAVAQVILNRVRNPTFPDTICGVVYQNRSWFNRCQFSFACDRIRDRITPGRHWETAKAVALATTSGKIWLDSVGSSTHYHADYVYPHWAPTMVRLTKIGRHIFYRTRNGGWS